MIEAISGIVTAVVIIILSQVLSRYFTTKLYAATILVAIAFIYVGFSLKDNPVSLIIVEIVFALALYTLAIVGYTRNSLLIAYGIILHGLWDIVHHNRFLIGTDIPGYWPSFCFIIDIIDGLYFLIVFKKGKALSHLIK
ncbi:MAG: DUF6010 family protein [Bacteroidota bacterium]|nr:DUF6010 family protein [Bacteroidota bacterium]